MSNLEDELRKLQPRTPPQDWRAAILAECAATAAARETQRSPSWREWLWPSPVAWGALAAIWLALAVLQNIAPSPAPALESEQRPMAVTIPAELNRLLADLR